METRGSPLHSEKPPGASDPSSIAARRHRRVLNDSETLMHYEVMCPVTADGLLAIPLSAECIATGRLLLQRRTMSRPPFFLRRVLSRNPHPKQEFDLLPSVNGALETEQ